MSMTTTDRAHLALRINSHGTVSLQVVGRTVPKTPKRTSGTSVCVRDVCSVWREVGVIIRQ